MATVGMRRQCHIPQLGVGFFWLLGDDRSKPGGSFVISLIDSEHVVDYS